MKSFLNIAAGKINPLKFENKECFLVQLDKMYWAINPPNVIETEHAMWLENPKDKNVICHTDLDVFEFLGNYKFQFDNISCYRFLEHITKTEIQTFIYLLSTALKVGGELDIIVPNYETLADMILTENLDDKVKHSDWEKHDTMLTYELLNEPSMPHASIWTPARIRYFFNLEERFELRVIEPNYEFDGRDLYIRAVFRRIK